jgi:amino acid adenylation domain-containing protein
MFVLQNAPAASAGEPLEDVVVSGVARGRPTSMYDLSLSLYAYEGSFYGQAEYAAELFDPPTVRRMVEHLDALLGAALDSPGVPLSRLPPLSDEDRAAARDLASGPTDHGSGGTVLELIDARTAEAPDALAVEAEDGSLTYAELGARADTLAAFLRARGVGAESRVAIAMERGLPLAVSVLGVVKAGAAYVPLDPAYPAERIEWMLADCGAALVLTQASLAGRMPAGAPVIAVDAEWERVASAVGDADLPADVHPLSAAYVIYTSGSTGRPKGVVVTHAGMVNNARAHAALAKLAPADRVLQFASFSFDISVEEIFPTWAAGAALVFRPAGLPDAAAFSRLVEERGITVVDLPTAYFHEWMQGVDEGAAAFPRTLRLATIGGERARPDSVAAWARRAGGRRLLNSYGPTEATITATAHEAGAHADPRAEVPIGRPLAGVRAYVLDGAMRPAPVGVPGELYLGGVQVARGYLGRPALTAAAFVPDPLADEPGARLYRTGDRVRWKEGVLEFLGRVDDQVKVRGFRVEPGEIEAVLRGFPGVRETVVVAHGEGGEKRLAAYVAGQGVDAAALRAHAAARLPEHMVPAAFAVLAALPLTPSGKVDRRALPAPDLGAGRAAPRTPTEEVLAGIWAALLGVERVGADDGFFDLGGHSLLATRLVARVREAFGVDVPMRAVFEDPVLARFAARVDEAVREAVSGGVEGSVPPLVPVGRDGGLPLSYGQERFWVMDRLGAGALALAVPIAFPPDADAGALEGALAEVARRHEALRTVFRAGHGGGAEQVVLPPSAIPLPVEELRALAPGEAGAAVQAALAAAGREAMDLERGPLVRARLLRLAEASLLVVSVHHAVFDGWSTGVLERELRALYEAFSRGLPSPLAPLPVQYADWAAWQRRWMESGALEAQAEFWRRALAGAPAPRPPCAPTPAPGASSISPPTSSSPPGRWRGARTPRCSWCSWRRTTSCCRGWRGRTTSSSAPRWPGARARRRRG